MDFKIQCNGVYLQVYEKGNKKSNIMFIFLHGGPGSGALPLLNHDTFQELEKEYLCIYFDQRGSGASTYDLKKGLTENQLTLDVHIIVENCKLKWKDKKIVLWGGSFGGLLASLYIEQYDDVDLLVLSSPAVCFDRKESLALFERMSSVMKKRLPIHMKEEKLMLPEMIFENKHFHDFIFSEQNPSQSLRHIAAMSSWLFQYNATACFQSIKVPTLILIGDQDNVVDARALVCAIERIHNANIKIFSISSCGHEIFSDQSEDFIQMIKAFVEKEGRYI